MGGRRDPFSSWPGSLGSQTDSDDTERRDIGKGAVLWAQEGVGTSTPAGEMEEAFSEEVASER